MTRTSSAAYSPGGWVAASSESAWLLVDLGLDDARLTDCWAALAGEDADRVIDVLLSQGLSGLPGFALVVARPSGTRVVARHPAVVTCRRDGEEPRVVTGGEGRTWADVELPEEYDEIALSAGDDGLRPIRLPLAHGITPAGLLTVTTTSGPAPAPTVQVGNGQAAAPVPNPHDVPAQAPAVAAPEPAPEPDLAADHAESPEESPDDRPEQEPATGAGSSYYGRLLGATVDRDALLAELAESGEDDDEQPAPVATLSESTTSGHTAIWQPDAPAEKSADDELTESDVEPHAPVGDGAPVPPEPEAAGALIDGVPWATGSSAPVPPPRAEPVVVSPGFAAPTSARPPATPTPEVDLPRAPTPIHAPASDSGTPETEVRTVNRAELLKSLAAPVPTGPMVLAVRCPRAHLSSAYSAHCRVCGEVIEEQVPTEQPRPALGRLVLSTGETVILDRDVVLGRAPESAEEDPALRPNLVRLTDSGEVSRMHVRVTLDGWQPMIRDLGSSNGTTLTLSSSSPQQLRPQEDYVLEPGCEVTLADVVSFRFDVTA